MSLYNQLFGVNPLSPELFAAVGLTDPKQVGRFRDCYMEEVDGEVQIVIYTRNGEYEEYAEITAALHAMPNFVRDWVDDFDSTFRSYVFRPLPEFVEIAAEAYKVIGPVPTPREKWDKMLAKLKDPSATAENDPDMKHMMEVGERILGPVLEKIKNKKEGDGPDVNVVFV